ncbi:unnamed protein product [Boreogadus saida]
MEWDGWGEMMDYWRNDEFKQSDEKRWFLTSRHIFVSQSWEFQGFPEVKAEGKEAPAPYGIDISHLSLPLFHTHTHTHSQTHPHTHMHTHTYSLYQIKHSSRHYKLHSL